MMVEKLSNRAYQYSIKAIRFIDGLSKDNSTSIMSRQVLRSATSIGANIVEAKAARTRRDYTNFYNHALKSANETVYWLSLLKEAKGINNSQIDELLDETKQLGRILGSSILTLKDKF